MLQNNLFSKIAIIISYSLLFFLTTYFGNTRSLVDVVLFLVGLLLGMALLEADENYFYKYYAEKSDTTKKLVTRSLLFLIMLFPLGLFLMTSTGSVIGVGLFLSIISGLSLEFYFVRNDSQSFHARFMSQLKRKVSAREQQTFTWFFIISSLLYAFFVIF